MAKRQQNKLAFGYPKRYDSKVLRLEKWTQQYNPIAFINKLCQLKGLKRVEIIHKPLKFSAEFKLPDKILVDFRNPEKYILLSLAHEYAHLLLRTHILIPYTIEQSLAILLQLAYEDSANIRKFNQKTAKELMEIMNVWPIGKILLKNWPDYWSPRTSKITKYRNILTWLKKQSNSIEKSSLTIKTKENRRC